MKTEELLKVLDMSEDEQCKWLSEYFKDKYYETNAWHKWYGVCDILIHDTFPGRTVILADLAFRLRGEVCKEINGCEKYHKGLEDVYNHYYGDRRIVSFYAWSAYQIKPIDMIIAALIAKNK